MRLTMTVTALLLALPAAAQEAEDRLDRMERLTGAMMTQMYESALGGDTSGVDMEIATGWNDEMREAASCVLDAHLAEGSEEEVDAVFDRMEEIVAAPVEDFEGMADDMADMGGIVSPERAVEINQACGMTALQMQRMQESGLMNEMMERGEFE